MPYIEDRIVHDADAHIMETPDWLKPFSDPDMRDAIQVEFDKVFFGPRSDAFQAVLDKHDDAVKELIKKPGQQATYELVNGIPTGKQTTAACFDSNQVEQYKKLILKSNNIVAALEKVKADRNTPADDPALIESERGLLFAANPEWLDKENKTTETFKKDTALMNAYVSSAGFSSEEFNKMTSSRQLTTILKAAKYDELQEKGRKIKEKRDKVPVVTKPKANTDMQPTSMADTFYGENAG